MHRKITSVLVHCYAGVSRSASVCIAYLMKKFNWSLEKSLWFIKSKRRFVNPN
jgi:protein-tyrosine phosphatase